MLYVTNADMIVQKTQETQRVFVLFVLLPRVVLDI